VDGELGTLCNLGAEETRKTFFYFLHLKLIEIWPLFGKVTIFKTMNAANRSIAALKGTGA
jgi:hypothetical protein